MIRMSVVFILFSLLLISCDKYQKKEIDELKYIPVFPSEISIVVDGEDYYDFPTIIKFTKDKIIISRFHDSKEYDTGYEDYTIEITDRYYIEDSVEHRKTILKTKGRKIEISPNSKNSNIYYLKGLSPKRTLTLAGIDNNTFNQIKNLRR